MKRVSPQVASHIVRMVPDKAFLFAQAMGDYTGDAAHSLGDFLETLQRTSPECLKFHLFPRPPDFERWIRETLGDSYLANQISRISRSVTGDALRHALRTLVEDRLNELHIIAMTQVKGIGVQYATRLVDAGLLSVNALAQARSIEVAKQVGVSETMAARWIQNARALA